MGEIAKTQTFMKKISFLIYATWITAYASAATYTVPGKVGVFGDKCIWKNVEGIKDKKTGQVVTTCLSGDCVIPESSGTTKFTPEDFV